MLPRRIHRLAVLVALAGLVVTLPACSGDDPAGPNGNQDPYVGSWTAQSFTTGGTDFVAMGFNLQGTFTTSTYSLAVTNDVAGICDGSTSCTVTGDLSGTGSQITFDPGTQDEAVFDYSVVGSTMTLTGDIDGSPLIIVFSKTS